MNSFIPLIFALLISSALGSSWTNCGDSADKLQIATVAIATVPTSQGENVTFRIVGTLSETLTGGSLSVSVTFLGIPVYSETDNLCTLQSCPITQGAYDHTFSVASPVKVPGATISAHVTAEDQTNAPVLCVNAQVTL
eukprot:Phypoly_transcript_25889.p1 GENE.Phypoly_transcript_25889~~Phypoly_transcript_25889.p1  ORF type:complete len:161 (+),score=8.56 Phypoly_transcript_25889:72-485(+)